MKYHSKPGESHAEVTRLLLQKSKPYAELEENSRIALSILQDDDWKLHRIGMELQADFTFTAVPVERPGIETALADAEARYIGLREQVVCLQQHMLKLRRRQWLAAAAGCFLCSALAYFHLGVTMTPIGAACVMAWRFVGYRRTKGAA